MNIIEVHLHPLGGAGRVFTTHEVHFRELIHLALIGPPTSVSLELPLEDQGASHSCSLRQRLATALFHGVTK